MAKIFEFRGMIESGVAEVAALKATDEQICRLEKNYERMRRHVEALSQFVYTDLDFHMLVSECTQNTLAVQIFNSYEGLLGPSILHMTEAIGVGNGLKYHGLILDAVRSHDLQRARAVMQEHMEDNMERFKRFLKINRNTGT